MLDWFYGRYGAIIASMVDRLTLAIRDKARTLGFSMAGVVEAMPGRRLEQYQRWLARGYHGQMGYLARPDRLDRRSDLGVILPGVRSILCVGLDYGGLEIPAEIASDPGRGRISNYAWAADYHGVMVSRMEKLASWLKAQGGGKVSTKVYVDTGAIMERDHGESAGLGFTGKNTMLIAPRAGSYFFLGEILTTLALEPDRLDRPMPTCGSCRRCLDVCPTGAFPEPYVLDARRCISYLTIELKGWIPAELRPMTGNWVYGCDLCQEVCPFNRFTTPSSEPLFRPASWDAAAPPLLDLLAIDEAAFEARFRNSPILRIKRRGLVRNACVAAGNWGHASAIDPLRRLLADPEPIIRGHAAWALGRIEFEGVQGTLDRASKVETDGQVRKEMLDVLARRVKSA